MFKVKELNFKNDTVLVSFDDFNILLLLDFYIEEKIKINDEYDTEVISKLLKEELYTNAYLKVLNKLKYKDRTISEIEKYVTSEFSLEEVYLKKLINDLIKKGYLDDDRYTKSYIDSAILNFKGKRLIIQELKDKGIEKELIDSIINDVVIDEKDLAITYANRIAKTIKNKSLNSSKQFIKQKLLLRGFDFETSDFALTQTDFSSIISNQDDLLEKAMRKAVNRYKTKYHGYEFKNKIIKSLMTQGFRYDDINEVLLTLEEFYE